MSCRHATGAAPPPDLTALMPDPPPPPVPLPNLVGEGRKPSVPICCAAAWGWERVLAAPLLRRKRGSGKSGGRERVVGAIGERAMEGTRWLGRERVRGPTTSET